MLVGGLAVWFRPKVVPCHHQGTLPIGRFRADEILGDIESRCRCTVCGWRRADLRPDYSKRQAAPQSVGWMMPP
jgi:hypothetical protein